MKHYINIYIYANDNGIPGTLVYSAETQPYSASFVYYDIDKITIKLTNPAALIPGRYFISVQAITDTLDYCWYWGQAIGSFGYAAQHSSNSVYWHPVNSIFGDILTDMYFELYGTSSALTRVAEDKVKLPSNFELGQNYPNPFNPSTNIGYQLQASDFVTLKIYDILGREITSLVNKEQSAGNYEVTFDASKLSSGIYFYKLQAGNFVETKKMTLVR